MADGDNQPTRGRLLLAGLFVALTVIATWTVINYRSQPPPPPSMTAPQ
jgi:hypothetical protein